ncbi:polysaccharide biosynthesis protein [Deinococcus arenicola]|uniref:Nucleoside-diphosphate sugar epimerase/dehydratase n=1 Tax=Deinococcus arenicola TaxID=2994950 RepID=A0ABU4DKW5_9DEIO|nr:nucleoside-diphosphate sugar epimerase/dehydratase [Deinococcus sp. ZS9-10]MDV6373060.1 nucleoside-diphosphate sugar epimerase/dehydratase [Deinococcus sp. ZS9-10]
MNTSTGKFLLDLLAFTVAAALAYLLRLADPLGDLPPATLTGSVVVYTLVGLPLKYLALRHFRVSRHIWRYVTFEDLNQLIRTAGVVAAAMLLLTPLLRLWIFVPWSIPLIEGVLALGLLSGTRLLVRWRLDQRRQSFHAQSGQIPDRVLIAGAGNAGRMVAADLLRSPEKGMQPVAFIDDSVQKRDMVLIGLPVLGPLSNLQEVAKNTRANLLIIAMPSAGGQVIRQYVDAARQAGLQARTVPGLYELAGGQVTTEQLRSVSVEDLLRRDPVEIDQGNISEYLKGQTVLVTGAGGSIGSELVRQLARFGPARLILVGRGENSIFAIEQEMRREWPDVQIAALIADVRQAPRLEFIFETYRPGVVFHAAAHKHVPLMETAPSEAVHNNILGTRNVAELCLKYGVTRLVNISTDKAVNPTSVMGASKRVAEMVIADAASRAAPGQAFVSVRFGNVLGSRGSVVPTFLQQIRLGGPLTITHPDMTRYFMTIPEASRLVLQAGGLADNGNVYLLDMGEPVKIADLARDVIRLSGAQDIEIVYSGMRPGEKLYEELLTSGEDVIPTHHSEIFSAQLQQIQAAELALLLADLTAAAGREDGISIRTLLHAAIHESQLLKA